jgi:hypothetical protein
LRILLIGQRVERREDIRNFSGVWSFYLARELEARGVGVRFAPASMVPADYASMNVEGVDHVVALGTRHFSKVDPLCATILRRRIPGAITQIHDSCRADPGVVTFTVRDCGNAASHHYIGWAADPEVCKPDHEPGVLGILIDHPDYGAGARPDHSHRIVHSVAAFARSGPWRKRWKSVRVRRIVDGTVEDVNLASPSVPAFSRQHVGFEDLCRDYSRAHLFMTTHPEGVGLSVLEAAMSGALPLVPAGFVQRDRLATVRHLEYKGAVPWAEALQKIDVPASRAYALNNSWSAVAERLIGWLRDQCFSRTNG